MKTYTLATATRLTGETVIQPIAGLPLMTIAQARRALDIARANGHDVVIYNAKAE